MENVASKRGKEKLNHEGYCYVFDKFSADHSKKFWRCELKNECKARLHTTVDNDRVLMQMNQHSHGSDAAQLRVAMIMTGIKRRATKTTDIPSVILNSALQGTSTAVQAKMPNKDAILKVIQRSRNDNRVAPPQPIDRASIIIPDAYRMITEDSEVEMSERTDDQEAMLAAFQKESENSQDSLADIQVKDEPEDSSYEQKQSPEISSCPDSRNSSPLPPIHFENSSPFHTNVSSPVPTLLSKGNTAAQIPLNDIFAGSTIRSQLQGAIDGKKMDTVQNIVEGLLKKNETLLAMSDAGLLKPNPRRVRAAYDSHARKSTQTRVNVFPISSTLQARMNPSKKISESFRPHIIRPKSPTLRSNSILKDKTQFTYALLESKICDDEIEKIFKVQNHEIVCGISSRSYLADECDKIVASLDLDYFWCNFCPFATSNKPLLIQHALEHRFKCKFCAYESFCRSDIVRHMHKLHSDFSEVAGRLSYCTLLSDYLRVKARAEGKENKDPDENVDDLDPQEMNKAIQELEGRKRKAESSSHGISSSPKAARLDSDDVESSSDLSRKSRKSQNPKRCPPPKDSDYDMFEMEVEEISESPQDAGHEESDSDRVLYSSSHSSPNPYFHTQDGHPFPTGMMQVIPGMQSQSGSMQTSAPRTKPGQTNTGCRGRGRGIRGPRYASSSSLYWSCGYCTFQSNSQAEIKEHSNRAHPGKPHRYVALIKNLTPDSVINKSPRSTSTLNPIGKQSTLSTSSGDSLHRSHSPLVQMSPSASLPRSPQVSTESHATNGEEDIEDTEEVVSLKETSSLLKVRINPVRSTRKENIVYRCYHCTYTAKRHSAMKSHIYYKHRGKGLVAVDDESQPKQHIFFCARDDCTFKSERADSYLHHVDQCTPWNKPELADVEVEPHIRECLEQTVLLAETTREKGFEIEMENGVSSMGTPAATARDPPRQTAERDLKSKVSRPDVQEAGIDSPPGRSAFRDFQRSAGLTHADNAMKSVGHVNKLSCHNNVSVAVCETPLGMETCRTNQEALDIGLTLDCENIVPSPDSMEILDNDEVSQSSDHVVVLSLDKDNVIHSSDSNEVLTDNNNKVTDAPDNFNVFPDSALVSHFSSAEFLHVNSSNDDENPDYDKVPANSCSNDKVPANATDSGKVPANATGDYKVPANASVVDELLSNASDHEVLSHELDSDESLDHDEILDHDDILDIPVSDLSYSPCNEDALLVDSGDTLVHIHAKNDAFPHHLAVDEGFPHALANNDALQDAPANNYAPESDDALPCAAAKNETPGSDFVIPHASANDDARPHASESYDAFPHATESYDALPHATESYDAPESDDARPHAPESDDARPHASESYDALPHATEIDDALTHAPESYYTLPNASDVPENQDILAEKFTQCSDNINVHSDVSIHVPDNDHMLIDDTEQFTQCSDNINVQSDVSVYGSETYENVHHVPCSGYVQYAESLETALDTQTPMDQTHSCETDDNVDSLNLSVCSDDNFIPVGVCDVRCQTAQLQDISVQNNDTSSYLQLCTPNERKSEQTVSDKHELHNERSSSLSDIEDIIEPDAVLEDNSVNENRSQSESYVAAENFALTLTMPADGQSLDMDTYVDQIEVAVETVITTDSELIEDVPYLPAQESPNSMTGSSTQESSNSVTDLPTNDSSNAVTNLPTQESSNSVTSLPTQESSNAVTSLKTQESSNAVTNLPTQESSNAVTNLPTQESSNSVTNLPTQGNSNSVTGPPSPMPCPSPAKRSPDYIPNVHTSKTDAQHLEIKTTLGISMLKNSHKSSQTRSAGSSTLKNSPKSSLSKSDTDHFKQEQKLLSPTVNSLKLKFKMLGHTTICSMSDQPAESKTEPIASEDSDSNSSSVSTTSSSSDESGSEDETGTKPPAEKQIPKWLDELIDSTGDSDSDIASNSCSNPPSVSSGSESHSVECPLQADPQKEVPGDMKTAQTDAPICVPQMVRKIPVVQESQSSASDSKLRRSNSSNMVLSCVPARSAAVKALSKMKPLLSEEQAVDVDSDYCGKFKKIVQKSKTLYPKTKTAVNTSHEMTDHQKPSALERSNGAGKSAASVKRSAAVYMCGYCLGISEGSLKKIKPHVLTKHSSMPPMVINCFKQRMHRQCNFYICPQLTCSRLFSREKDFEMHRRSHSEESSSQKSQGGTRRDSLTSRGLPFSGGLSGAPTVRTSTRTSVAHFPSLRVELDMLDVRKLKTTVRQEEKKYLCLYCTDYFYDSSLTGMKSHYSKDHAGQLMVMRDTEARKAQLPSRIYVCEMPNCECHYISRPDLDHHSKGHKSNSTYIYECACCGWYSSSHLGAVQHVRSQHGDESNVSLIHMQVSVDEYGQTSKKVL